MFRQELNQHHYHHLLSLYHPIFVKYKQNSLPKHEQYNSVTGHSKGITVHLVKSHEKRERTRLTGYCSNSNSFKEKNQWGNLGLVHSKIFCLLFKKYFFLLNLQYFTFFYFTKPSKWVAVTSRERETERVIFISHNTLNKNV